MVNKAEIGRFDGELKSVVFSEGDTVQALFNKVGLTVSEGESVRDENDSIINLSDTARNEATYFITGNFKQGC